MAVTIGHSGIAGEASERRLARSRSPLASSSIRSSRKSSCSRFAGGSLVLVGVVVVELVGSQRRLGS